MKQALATALGVALVAVTSVATMPRVAWADPAPDEPPLPTGLGDDDEPDLPTGLGDGDDEPGLPSGLGDSGDAPAADQASAPADHGPSRPFVVWKAVVDVRAGARTQSDPHEDAVSLAEARVQLQLSKSFTPWSTTMHGAVDFVFDAVADDYTPDLETGAGVVDVRSANLVTSPTERLDVKVGRHVLTWGTGDLLFINDLFPKDWTSFLAGRDLEYLKAPSDALKLALFAPKVALDLVFTPRLDADRLPDRGRLSSWDPALGRIAGQDAPIAAHTPDRWFRDPELAARLYRNVSGWEVAAYGYYGFWKSPAGFDPATGNATHPALAVYGASARGTVAGGIAHAEVGYYDSLDDRGGDDPTVRNSELRGLVGYERSLSKKLTASGQYYMERMRFPGGNERGLPPMAPVPDTTRHVVTLRLHWHAMSQNLQSSLFVFASPSDLDGYVRPSVHYKIDDRWRVGVAGNVLFGADDHTFFGQLRNNTNVYASVRYSR